MNFRQISCLYVKDQKEDNYVQKKKQIVFAGFFLFNLLKFGMYLDFHIRQVYYLLLLFFVATLL